MCLCEAGCVCPCVADPPSGNAADVAGAVAGQSGSCVAGGWFGSFVDTGSVVAVVVAVVVFLRFDYGLDVLSSVDCCLGWK